MIEHRNGNDEQRSTTNIKSNNHWFYWHTEDMMDTFDNKSKATNADAEPMRPEALMSE